MTYTPTNPYCQFSDVQSALRMTDTVDEDRINLAIDAASRQIENKTGRRFWQDTATVSNADGNMVSGTAAISSASVNFLTGNSGRSLTGFTISSSDGGIPAGATILSVTDATHATLSVNATTSPTTAVFTIGPTSARVFVALTPFLCEVDDFMTTQGLVIQFDPYGDGSFPITLATTDYQLEPLNGLSDGQVWPYEKFRDIRTQINPVYAGIAYPQAYVQAQIKVTAQWGWSYVPSEILKATISQAMFLFKSDDAPFGATPFGEMGIIRLKNDLNPVAMALIDRYCEDIVRVA